MIITIAHQKGGVGKSTITTNLAVEMNLPIIDLDSQHSCYLFSLLRKEERGKTLEVYISKTLKEIKRILENMPELYFVHSFEGKREHCVDEFWNFISLSFMEVLSVEI